MNSRIVRGGAAVAALVLAGITLSTPAFAADDAKLSVVHGIPGVTVDVWVNGALTLDDFAPSTIAGPLSLPAATYSVAITASDATAATDKVVLGPVDLPLAAGSNSTAVAYLGTDGKPAAKLFNNDISNTAAGEGRLTVRHVANAPAVDVLANGTAAISGLKNAEEKVLNLPEGTISAGVAAAGTTTPVLIGPADVPVMSGVNTIVYAYGSAADGNLALAVQTIEGLSAAPKGVPAGEAGLAATNTQENAGLPLGELAVVSILVLGTLTTLGVVRSSRVRASRANDTSAR